MFSVLEEELYKEVVLTYLRNESPVGEAITAAKAAVKGLRELETELMEK